jgi:hypothetical protein
VKKSTLVILSVAALAGMSSLANATPTGVENFISVVEQASATSLRIAEALPSLRMHRISVPL